MTTNEISSDANLEKVNENLAKVEELSERLVNVLAHKRKVDPSLQGPGQDLMVKAASAYWNELLHHPSKIFETQVGFWGKTLQHFLEAQEALATGKLAVPEDRTPKDRRFSNPLWETHPYFNFVKQQYLLSAEAIEKAVKNVDGLNAVDRQRLEYFSKQIVDLMAPTNFLATNPDALEKAVATEGASLVLGLENLVRDLEASQGELMVSLADKAAFTVGQNIATTPGEVVFRNRMLELIQYTPTTEQVYSTPLIIFPPWINKFYVLDLKAQNSLIKWIVDQGFTVFVASWVNPDNSYAGVGMDQYVEEGYLAAIEEVKKITDQPKVNAIGYCIAGTTLSLTLALLQKRGDKSVRSATFFTTMTDFSDQGEFTVFLQDDFVDGIERVVQEEGMLDSFYMSRTFSYLRSNDLIYGPAIRSYMMGEAPPAFDLLYWNGDSTNLPGKMAVEYLRGLCQKNSFVNGGFKILGETVHIKDVKVPLCAIACETDHIATWRSSFNGVKQMGSRDKSFIVSESGHIAGIVNPPSKKKYGHYTSDAPLEGDPDTWLSQADYNVGSWWPRWGDWLRRRSGKKIPARHPGDSTHPSLAKAPGTYVMPK